MQWYQSLRSSHIIICIMSIDRSVEYLNVLKFIIELILTVCLCI